MFTKKDLFWSVKGLYPDVKIGTSLADYKKAVADYLSAKFGIAVDNAGLLKFVKTYTEKISTLLKKFHRNFHSMVASKDHTEFFGASISLQSFDLVPPPPASVSIGTQVERSDFQTTKATLTPQGRDWIPHSWKRPSKAAVKAASSNAATSNGEPPAKVPRLALTSNDPDSSGEPPAKAPRLVQIRQTQRDAKSVRKEAPSTDVCIELYDRVAILQSCQNLIFKFPLLYN